MISEISELRKDLALCKNAIVRQNLGNHES